jgi:hypothetical protein
MSANNDDDNAARLASARARGQSFLGPSIVSLVTQ